MSASEEDPFRRYLAAKRTVDDRALNQGVLARMRAELGAPSVAARRSAAGGAGDGPRILEIGAGIGTMVARLVDWGVVGRGTYTLLDEDAAALAASRVWLADWALGRGYVVAAEAEGARVTGAGGVDLLLRWEAAELGRFLEERRAGPAAAAADLLIASAVLDLVDVPALLPGILDLVTPGGLAWLSINYDGDTIFEPGHAADDAVLTAYDRTMDQRVRHGRRAGESHTGRHLFTQLAAAGAEILAAGSSDWVVHAVGAGYPADEGFFVGHILDTIDLALAGRSQVAAGDLAAWLAERRAQLAAGRLVYVAHQLDLLARVKPGG